MAERAGFYGSIAFGGSYEFNDRHAVDFSIGEYLNDQHRYHQSNLSYRYSRWQMDFDQNKIWRPLQIGVFTVRSWDGRNYFLTSPGKYPYEQYYDETALRYGVEFGSTFTFTDYNFGISYRLRILDSGLIALYNNRNRDLQYYISSGLSFQYVF